MKTKIILLSVIAITAILHLFKINTLPICLNADEAAFGYNAFSILQTGKDEYGVTLPLRLKSFGDYKLPLYAYLTIPFVATMGLSELAVRMVGILAGIAFPLALYFLTKEIFEKEKVALLAAFLAGMSTWIQILSRHAHEVTVAALLLTICATMLLRFIKTREMKYLFVFSFLELLSLFTYHISRPVVLALIVYLVYSLRTLAARAERRDLERPHRIGEGVERWTLDLSKLFTRKNIVILFIAILPFVLFTATDLLYNPTRVKNLIFFNDGGFKDDIRQKLVEKNAPILYNPITQALIDLPHEYLKYFSPEFLVIHGDANFRFGHPGISLISIIEYFFIFVGMYYLIKKKPERRGFVLLMLLISPIAASLTFLEYSATRSFFMVVPLLMIISYGAVSLLEAVHTRYRFIAIALIALTYFFFTAASWDFYFFHYSHKAVAQRSWQCGYKELATYAKNNYDRFDRFNITTRNGEPYIFMLFYLKYPPAQYQKQAKLSPPDQYGFGQVWGFDKFDFQFNLDNPVPKTSYIGFPEHFKDKPIDQSSIQKIMGGTEEIFWIYEK